MGKRSYELNVIVLQKRALPLQSLLELLALCAQHKQNQLQTLKALNKPLLQA